MSLFDPTNAVSTGVPDGEYTATVVGAEMKTSQKGGEYLNLKWQIEGGASFYQMYTTKNESQLAQNIGLAAIGAIQMATIGMKKPVHDVQELIGLRCIVVTGTKTDSYGDKVVVKKYKKAAEEIPF